MFDPPPVENYLPVALFLISAPSFCLQVCVSTSLHWVSSIRFHSSFDTVITVFYMIYIQVKENLESFTWESKWALFVVILDDDSSIINIVIFISFLHILLFSTFVDQRHVTCISYTVVKLCMCKDNLSQVSFLGVIHLAFLLRPVYLYY